MDEKSFEMINEEKDNYEDDEDEIRIAYLEKDYIPEIRILDKNKMICGGIEYLISDYYNQIKDRIEKIKDKNDNSDYLLDDTNYNICGLCKNNRNEYFCENCNKNICKNCYKNCKEDEHKIQNLEKFKDRYKEIVSKIRNILGSYIIPLKEEENIINENNIDFWEKNTANFDILLIYDFISLDYNNYFHYKNAENISTYCLENYSFIDKPNNSETKGKNIFYNGSYYIGQYKNGKRNGKGKIYYPNGNIKYDGDFVDDKREGNGKIIFESGSYYIGQFKNDLPNGKGIEYDKNGNIIYDGDFVDAKREGNGKIINKDGSYYIGQFKNDLPNGKGKFFNKK